MCKYGLDSENLCSKYNSAHMQYIAYWFVSFPQLTPSGNVDTHRRKLDHGGGNTGLFGRPGGGAPLRTHSGRVAASLKGDPETRFQQQTRKEVEHILVSWHMSL